MAITMQSHCRGSNHKGQCGHRLLGPAMPGPIHALTPQKLVGVACGAAHTLALTEGGRVYSFGLNSTGQLGKPRSYPWGI